WWLTFDLPVPLFLSPATIEARAHDVALIREHLAAEGDATGLYGHELFTTGQEWGYWLIDYCFARISWNADFDDDACFADFADRFRGADEILAVLQAVRDRQVADLRDPEILRLLVGSDDETEVAEQVGIRFHPLPAPPAAVLGWDQARAAAQGPVSPPGPDKRAYAFLGP
ncbi:MAG: hypothetical protein RQ748_05975, partial [Elusimicrobiales bacterium]|nr:hypothetical protein [Elusimicrobiales bacterium]